jgi:hypothetical protein
MAAREAIDRARGALIRARLENGEQRFAVSQKDLERLVALAERALDPAIVLVPREPTEAMIMATVEPMRPILEGMIVADDTGHVWTDKPGVSIVAEMYRAMIAAAPQRPDLGGGDDE